MAIKTLVCKGITKSIKNRKIVNKVSLEVSSGEVIGLLGPNGAGKTTCFYMILGLINVDSGTILLNHKDITKLPVYVRAKMGIGYLAQEPSVFRKLTVIENILAILELNDNLSHDDRNSYVEKLLQDFNLQHIRNSYGISLSGGERRRVEIARTLASFPDFILLDEPFSGIDPLAITEIQGMIVKLTQKGIAVIVSDHNVRETLAICNRVYIMNNAKILFSGSPGEAINNERVKDVYLGNNFLDRV